MRAYLDAMEKAMWQGPAPWLCPEQKRLLETDPVRARRRARAAMAGPLTMPNYRRNLMRSGIDEDKLDQSKNDRVVDAVVAWGDLDALLPRVDDHLEAGATHVAFRRSASKTLPSRT
jgi:hypothetical protein